MSLNSIAAAQVWQQRFEDSTTYRVMHGPLSQLGAGKRLAEPRRATAVVQGQHQEALGADAWSQSYRRRTQVEGQFGGLKGRASRVNPGKSPWR